MRLDPRILDLYWPCRDFFADGATRRRRATVSGDGMAARGRRQHPQQQPQQPQQPQQQQQQQQQQQLGRQHDTQHSWQRARMAASAASAMRQLQFEQQDTGKKTARRRRRSSLMKRSVSTQMLYQNGTSRHHQHAWTNAAETVASSSSSPSSAAAATATAVAAAATAMGVGGSGHGYGYDPASHAPLTALHDDMSDEALLDEGIVSV